MSAPKMKVPAVKDVRAALMRQARFSPTRIEFGLRATGARQADGRHVYMADVREWASGADLFDTRSLNMEAMREAMTPEGLALDLYVYSGIGDYQEFETNALLLIDAQGNLLACDTHGGGAMRWIRGES